MDAMNNLGFEVKLEMMEAPKTPCFLSNSIFSLFEVRKAISIPEQKAQAIRLPIITSMSEERLLSISRHAFVHTSSKQIPTRGNKRDKQIGRTFFPAFHTYHDNRVNQGGNGYDKP
jgi:hypothetical protein